MFDVLGKLHTLTWVALARGENKQPRKPPSKGQRYCAIRTYLYLYMYISTERSWESDGEVCSNAQIRFFWSACIDWNWVSKFNALYKMTPFLSPPHHIPPIWRLNHNMVKLYLWEGSLKSLNKNKLLAPRTRKKRKGRGFKQIVTTSKSAHPVKFSSLSFLFS